MTIGGDAEGTTPSDSGHRGCRNGCAISALLALVSLIYVLTLPAIHEEAFFDDDHLAVADAKQGAEQIIVALEKYKTAKRWYPASLSDLKPDFLPSILRPRLGTGVWNYVLLDHGFQISVCSGSLIGRFGNYRVLSYSSKNGSWRLHR